MFADDTMMIWAVNDEFESAKVVQKIECRRGADKLIGKRIPDSRALVPVKYGGPPIEMNSLEGIAAPDGWPFSRVPFQISRGYCPGTNVTQRSSCSDEEKPS